MGTVEISEPFFAISKALRQIYPEEYFLLLKKELLLKRLTPAGRENYVGSPLADGYLQEQVEATNSGRSGRA